MGDLTPHKSALPPQQQAIRDKCFHPSGRFEEFPQEDVETSIPARFEKIVRLYPDGLAVKDEDQSLTYDQLNRAANRIAQAILAMRGDRSEPIATLFEHGIDSIVAIFGLLKAGKFFVALDPSSPPEQIRNILADVETRLILSNGQNLGLARNLAGNCCEVLNVQEPNDPTSGSEVTIYASPENLAGVVYTSGSRGEPKGIALGQRQVLQSAALAALERNIQPEDRLSFLHHCSVGVSSTHLFQSLLNGASLFPFDIKFADVQRLARYLAEEKITILSLAPSLFRQFAPMVADSCSLIALRLITLVGAPVTRIDFEYYKKHFGLGTLLEIFFGSTEAGAISSAFIDHNFSFPDEGFPVGYPSRGKKILLLDEGGQIVGPGDIGEIAVMGDTLRLGYWRRPDLTSKQYIQGSIGTNERLCLTGDLGTMRPDGFLIYLGRKDDQVKIRGYRVELGAVERAILRHPIVGEAAVIALENHQGEKFLAAYIVRCSSNTFTVEELREFLKEVLPDYMVPTRFVFVESLPLMNGKLNRNALPLPDSSRPDLNAPYMDARSNVELELVRIWQEILEIRPIGIYDNFFALGGHSLAASRVIARVIQNFQLELPIKALFESPTVAQMAKVIEQNRARMATPEDLEQLLKELEAMSEKDAQRLLVEESVGD